MLCNNRPQNWVALERKPFCGRWRSVRGVSGELFPLTSAGLPGSSTQPSVVSGPEAPVLTPFVGPAEMQGPSTVTKASCRALLVLRYLTLQGPKQTQCEGWAKHPILCREAHSKSQQQEVRVKEEGSGPRLFSKFLTRSCHF